MKIKWVITLLMLITLLVGCDAGKRSMIDEIKINMSDEYGVSFSDIEVEVIAYGVSVFETNQFKVRIKERDTHFLLVQVDGRLGYKRIMLNDKEY